MRGVDLQGRPYAKIHELKHGQTIWLDGGFTCHAPGPTKVFKPRRNLLEWIMGTQVAPFFLCCEGEHCLDGQADDDGIHCVGVYPEDPGFMVWQMADWETSKEHDDR